ncbi:unnamed protein product [Trichobilharzia szidati]|nr:unnamed protein product [Trichobilharzia szidati]
MNYLSPMQIPSEDNEKSLSTVQSDYITLREDENRLRRKKHYFLSRFLMITLSIVSIISCLFTMFSKNFLKFDVFESSRFCKKTQLDCIETSHTYHFSLSDHENGLMVLEDFINNGTNLLNSEKLRNTSIDQVEKLKDLWANLKMIWPLDAFTSVYAGFLVCTKQLKITGQDTIILLTLIVILIGNGIIRVVETDVYYNLSLKINEIKQLLNYAFYEKSLNGQVQRTIISCFSPQDAHFGLLAASVFLTVLQISFVIDNLDQT